MNVGALFVILCAEFLDVSMGLEINDYAEGRRIMAIGDMNNDKHADIITVNSGQDSFTVSYYNPSSFEYEPATPFQLDTSNPNILKISSIVIARDMKELQSLYVIYKKNPDTDVNPTIKVLKQIREKVFEENKNSNVNGLQIYPKSEPTFLDINGDMM
jgi:hypothetical protein